jgi:predicted transcriptional regulator
MTRRDDAMAAVQKAVEEKARAEGALRTSRASLRRAVKRAVAAGATYSELGRVIGVTRQRVKQMLEQDA